MDKFDYSAPADLFPARSRNGHHPLGYRRFDTAAEAIQYAVEGMPAEFFNGTVLESLEGRLNDVNIRLMYDSDDYPLARNCKTAPQ
jgi:hypothetical protein